jgi:glycine cleavage system transcriptional repressor
MTASAPSGDRWAVWAFGADRPGIVVAVTGVLVERGHNLLDGSCTLLGGQFALMLLTDEGDSPGHPEALEAALAAATSRLGLTVAVRPVEPEEEAAAPGEAWMVAVYGSDRPGIVHQVAQLLADRGVNVTDLTMRVIGDPSTPVYAMLLEAELPDGVDADGLRAELAELASELGVEASLHPVDADVL